MYTQDQTHQQKTTSLACFQSRDLPYTLKKLLAGGAICAKIALLIAPINCWVIPSRNSIPAVMTNWWIEVNNSNVRSLMELSWEVSERDWRGKPDKSVKFKVELVRVMFGVSSMKGWWLVRLKTWLSIKWTLQYAYLYAFRVALNFVKVPAGMRCKNGSVRYLHPICSIYDGDRLTLHLLRI